MKLPSEFYLTTENGFYKVVYRPPHSGLGYELYEMWVGEKFWRHLTQFELALLRTGYEFGRKDK